MVEVKLKLNIKEVISSERMVGCWHCCTWETWNMQPEEPSEDKPININQEKDCCKKDQRFQGDVIPLKKKKKSFTLKEY